jgi:ribosomal protein S18 acetylase RimI-like enzyme
MTRKLIKITAVILALSFGGLALYYYFPRPTTVVTPENIQDYNEMRDKQEILDIFKTDKYWLLSSPDYSVEHMLSSRSPNKDDARYFGKLAVKVLHEADKFVGFVAYYMKNFFIGTVLFLDVKPEFRGKGYAQQLMRYAIDGLKKQGASIITLVTRSENYSAQAVYKKMGFTKTLEEDGYVYFDLRS